jgi:hypothetical protein
VMAGVDKVLTQCPQEVWPIGTGIVSFGSVLAVSTWTQLVALGVSTGTRPRMIPSALGAASVCLASLASHHMAVVVHGEMGQYKRRRKLPPSTSMLDALPDTLQQRIENSFDRSHSYRSRREELDLFGLVQVPMKTIRMYVQSKDEAEVGTKVVSTTLNLCSIGFCFEAV